MLSFFLATSLIKSACSLVKANQFDAPYQFEVFTSQLMILAISFKSLTNLEESEEQTLLECVIMSLKS